MSSAPLDELIASLGDQMVVTDPDILAGYRHDRANDPDAGTPMALIRPVTTSDVQVVVTGRKIGRAHV